MKVVFSAIILVRAWHSAGKSEQQKAFQKKYLLEAPCKDQQCGVIYIHWMDHFITLNIDGRSSRGQKEDKHEGNFIFGMCTYSTLEITVVPIVHERCTL